MTTAKTTNTATSLDLITTEDFHTIPCDFYKNMQDSYYLTREQIGTALGYKNPIRSIQNIHAKHKDRLDKFSIRIKSETFDNHQTDVGRKSNLMTERVYYSQRGVMEICRWSRQQKANEFMDWVWDIIKAYRNKSLALHDPSQILSSVTESLDALTESVNKLSERIDALEGKPKKLNLPKITDPKPPTRYHWSTWSSIMMPKYNELKQKYGCTNNSELYKELYKKFHELHPDYSLNDTKRFYCKKNNLNDCYTLEAIEYDDTVRQLFEEMVDNLLSGKVQ